MKFRYRYVLTATFALVATLALSATASASLINSAVTVGTNTLNDRNAERHNDANGNSIVDVGETIEAVLIVDDLSNLDFGGTPLAGIFGDNYQMTVHTLLTVAQIIDPNPGDPNALVTYVLKAGFDDGSAMRVYEDSNSIAGTILLDFASLSAADSIAIAIDGDHILSFDLSGALDQWVATGPKSFGLLDLAGGVEVQNNAGLSVSHDPMALPYSPGSAFTAAFGTSHDVVLFGSIFQAATSVKNQGWDAQSNTSFQFENVIPEPTSCALLVFGGLGLLVTRTRIRRR